MTATIRNRYNSLTETEKRIADAILEAPEAAVTMTAKELAARCGTVPSAVIRFSKSLGAQGFSDLKLRLSADLGARGTGVSMLPIGEGEAPEQVFGKVFASGLRTLEDTLSMMDFGQIRDILRILREASRIVFFGVGTSSVVAVDAQYRFAQLGLATAACTDILFMNVTAANLRPGEVAVGISHSGATRATVDALGRAKRAGAATVAITSFARSRLAAQSDYRIIAFSDDRNYPMEAVSARMAHMCILDALTMSLASQDYGTLEKHLSERNEVLQEMRYRK